MLSIEIAHTFASLGYFVFPLYKGKNGIKLKPFGWARNTVDPSKADKAIPATDDPADVDKWPDIVKAKYRSTVAGFGVLGVGVLILDLDVKDGKTGITEFKTLADTYHLTQPTMITVTKSGGLHLFYQRPKKYIDSSLKTMAGISVNGIRYPSIDLRGDGGFVVGPEVLVDSLQLVTPGTYGMVGLVRPNELPEFPAKIISEWLKTSSDSDIENLSNLFKDDVDFRDVLRKGRIPTEIIPKGARNDSFFIFINALKTQGTSQYIAKKMCAELAEKVEEPETFADSVDIDAMLNKAYVIDKSNPFDVARDLIDLGLYQVTGYKSQLHYVILEDNQYIISKNMHDEVSLKTLLKKFERPAESAGSRKSAMVNPTSLITKMIGNGNRVDMIGFKPKAGNVFSLHDEPGAKRFLNTYRSLAVDHDGSNLDEVVWKEFMLLVSRLFGEPDSDDFQLGMDFVAWVVQTPEIKPGIAPFIMSLNRGVGKSLLFNVLTSIMGTNKIGERQGRMVKLDEISGRFFDPSGCLINLIDEVQFPIHRSMRQESTSFWRHLKNLVTAETVSVEIKGGATYQCPNTAAIMLAGNAGGSFPIEEMDRRIWVIDNNPPLLEMGMVDNLFELVRRSSRKVDDRNRQVATLRYKLAKWKIKNDLGTLRAPMTDVKKELWMDSLTDTGAWFVEHFDDHSNVFALTPVVSQSALYYVWNQCGRSDNNDTDTFFRDLKRKGLIRPIRLKKTSSPSKQFTVPTVGLDGMLMRSEKREILYTTRDHGQFDGTETNDVMELYTRNCATIGTYRQKMMENRKTKTAESALIQEVR